MHRDDSHSLRFAVTTDHNINFGSRSSKKGICPWFTLFTSNKYYVATNTWHHQIMFHFLLRSYLPTLVISNQIFVQYCSSNVSLFAALHSLNGLYKCMELSQQFATFMKLALVLCAEFIFACLLSNAPCRREKHIYLNCWQTLQTCPSRWELKRISNFDTTFGRWRSVTSPIYPDLWTR